VTAPRLLSTLVLLALAASLQGTQLISHEKNPTFLIPAPGIYNVTLTVCYADGACASTTKAITVLDPVPRITSAVAQPTPVPIGQLVTFAAQATGKPSIAFHWTVTAPSGAPTLLLGNPVTWPTAGLPAGSYSVDLVADSPSGSASAHVGTVILIPAVSASFWTLPRPCRLLDTRSANPLLSSDPPRVFSASTATCSIPATAVAIAANVTAVNPTARGFLTLYPGNYYPPLTSTVSTNPRYPARSSFAVLPLSTDGKATLAARFGSDRPASTHLVIDLTGYFAPTQLPPPVALRFDSPLCPVFCIFPANAPLALHYQVSGAPTVYRYDWTGGGTFSQTSPAPLTSHSFASGYFAPRLQVAGSSGPSSTISFTPAILATDPVPSAAPPAPTGIHATFLGLFPADPLDPTQTAPQPAFTLSVSSPPGNTLLGWNVYFSLDGSAWALVTALPPDLPASAPLRLPPWDPSHHSGRIALAAINWAAQGSLSAPLTLTPSSGGVGGRFDGRTD
jgi:PKD repeat protein